MRYLRVTESSCYLSDEQATQYSMFVLQPRALLSAGTQLSLQLPFSRLRFVLSALFNPQDMKNMYVSQRQLASYNPFSLCPQHQIKLHLPDLQPCFP